MTRVELRQFNGTKLLFIIVEQRTTLIVSLYSDIRFSSAGIRVNGYELVEPGYRQHLGNVSIDMTQYHLPFADTSPAEYGF